MSYFLQETGKYGEMGTYLFAKVLCKSRDLCGNFCKAKSPTYYAVCIYTLTGFSVPSLPNTQLPHQALEVVGLKKACICSGDNATSRTAILPCPSSAYACVIAPASAPH